MQNLFQLFSTSNAKVAAEPEEEDVEQEKVELPESKFDIKKSPKKVKNTGRFKNRPGVGSNKKVRSNPCSAKAYSARGGTNSAGGQSYTHGQANGAAFLSVNKGSSSNKKHRAPSASNLYINDKDINKLLKKNTQELMSTLTPEVKRAFERLYEKLDINESGGINAKEIQNIISRYTKSQMTMGEIQEVLADLDLKGTGEFEFDEFIYMLSQPENYVRLLDKEHLKKIINDISDSGLKRRLKELQKNLEKNEAKASKKGGKDDPSDVFFKALRAVAQQDDMTILKSFYENSLKKLNDHVIHDWSAGQRCIGLSDKEMVTRFETIQGDLLRQKVNFCKDNSYKSSPYARPLEWGLLTLREGIEQRRYGRMMTSEMTELNKIKLVREKNLVKISAFPATPKAVTLPKYVVGRRHPLKKSFDYDQLADIRKKVDKVAKTYYQDLKNVSGDRSQVVKKELHVGDIRKPTARENYEYTFNAYCTPFVVSPWIPMPSPQRSTAPLGKSKFYTERM